MTRPTAISTAKTLSDVERQFLKIAAEELAKVKMGGPIALSCLVEIIASWHGHRHAISFEDYAQRWLLEGNAKNKVADRLLRDLFGLGDPDPRRAA
ncbi:hypothetical protein [Pseudomonas turukhanskensis]|uniref:Uncharacterized protein n=1 Tax=Pseudomonas turukhanskensis TaxID=1806536 RepID=A0A9W6NF09_9PSED|nr:hypothetical protein [Pseudomonas turukhanskensis]GLK88300.1 hypothetical protein GCM10017655_13620 [Pseudomonas turukhanskensis]